MSYIEKEKLIKADIASIENKVRHAFNQGYNLGFKDGKERTKALEQQELCDKCEIGNPCLYCKHEFEPQESEDKE